MSSEVRGCAPDWGDLNTFWDGEEMVWGRWTWGRRPHRGRPTIVRVFEMIEPRVELHEDKVPVVCELTFDQFAAMMDRRVESWRRPQFANFGRMLAFALPAWADRGVVYYAI